VSPIEVQIEATERQLTLARGYYRRATARRNMSLAFKWGQEVRQLIQKLEKLGELNDEGRSAYYIARGV